MMRQQVHLILRRQFSNPDLPTPWQSQADS
jgi:hypothetical protein